jgi:hypothetical protein
MITLNNNMKNIQAKERLSTYSQDILHRNHIKHLASTRNDSPNLKIHPRDKSHHLLQKCTRDKSRANSSRERRNHDE